MKLPMPYSPLSLSEVHRRRAMRVDLTLAELEQPEVETDDEMETA